MFTPRPLRPLLDVARLTGGDLERLVAGGARPDQIADALMREVATESPALAVLEDLTGPTRRHALSCVSLGAGP